MVVLYVSESPFQCGIANEDYLDHENPIAEVVNTKNEEFDSKIINGFETKPNEYPWQVALVKSGCHTPFCGGSIISDKVRIFLECHEILKNPPLRI